MLLELKLENMKNDLVYFNRIPTPASHEILCGYPKINSKLRTIWDHLCDMIIKTINGNYFLSVYGFQKRPEKNDELFEYNDVKINLENRYLIFDLENVNINEEDTFYLQLKYQ